MCFQDKPSPRRDSPAGSVDISELTNQNDERRTPTPEPTRRKTPVNSPYTRARRNHSDSSSDSVRLFTPVRSLCDLDIEHYVLDDALDNSLVAPKLKPAYDEPPFPFLQEANKMYICKETNRPNSSIGFHESKSDTEAEMELRRPCSGNSRTRARRKKKQANPNEISLAQKLFLYKKVMAYKESNQSTEK